MKPVDIEAASRLLSGTAFNAALWVAASNEPHIVLPKAIKAFRLMAEGLLANPAFTPVGQACSPGFLSDNGASTEVDAAGSVEKISISAFPVAQRGPRNPGHIN